MSDRIVLVTGGSGYVGSVLVPLLAKDFRVRVVETMTFGNPIADTPNVEFIRADILDYRALADAMVGVDSVIHLAGIVTDELVDMNYVKAMRVNLLGTLNVVNAARRSDVSRFIYASSSSVYGSQGYVAREHMTPKPQTVYAATKLVGEDIVQREGGAMTRAMVRSATCCGPAPRMRLDTIVNVFSAQAFFTDTITVHGGDQYRTNIHVQDAAEFYRLLMDADDHIDGRVFNIAQGFDTALHLAQVVAFVAEKKLNKAIRVDVDHTKRDDRHYRMSGYVAVSLLGWIPKKSLEDAVSDNLDWFSAGHIKNWEDNIWHNTKRMAEVMRAGN